MFILGQDKDVIFPLSDKGLFKSTLYAKDIYINRKYYGLNIYGKNLLRTCLLGTYEEDEGEQIVKEIYKLLKTGAKYYSMPEPALDFEMLGVEL